MSRWASAGCASRAIPSAASVALTFTVRKDQPFHRFANGIHGKDQDGVLPRRCTHAIEGRIYPMRTKTLWLWLPLLVTSLALVAAGCGGDDNEAAGTGATTGGTEAAEQVITVNWGTEPPSLDPGLATDVTSSNILLNIMDPLVKLDDDLNPVGAAAESFETSDDGKTVTYHAPRWAQVDERRPGHRPGLRVLVEAHRLARARRRLRVPVLRDRRRAGVQQLRSQEGRLRRAQGQDGRERDRRQDPRGQADEPAALVPPAVGAHLLPRGQSEDRREVRRQVDRAGEHRHERARSSSSRGSTTPASTWSSGTGGATPPTSS